MNTLEKVKLEYLNLRNQLDKEILRLENKHKNHLACKKGCDLCCLNFSVFPLEFEVILEETGGIFNPLSKTNNISPETPASCSFLNNHSCTIYNSRPFICRTHGLPLLYMNDDEWELSYCELNFTNVQEAYFDEKNTFSQDKWNSRLYMLNQKFIQLNPDVSLKDNNLIPLVYLEL